jgi:hypothetical protein
MAVAQFEGVIKQRSISVNLAALDERGFDVSNLVDVPIERLLALRGELAASGDMTITEAEIYIKGSHIRSDASDDEGPAWATIDLGQGVMRLIRPDQRMYIEMTREDFQQMAAYSGGGAGDQPDVSQVSGSKTINGLRSNAYDVTTYEGTARVWVSNAHADLATSFQRFAEPLQAMSMGDDSDPSFVVAEHGFPVLVLQTTHDTFEVEEVLAVEPQSVADALFVPPAGYQKMTMAEMMGGLMDEAAGGGAVAAVGSGGFNGGNGAASSAWVEYSISGPVTLNGREDDVVICSNTSDGFKARTLGDWVIDVEAAGSGSGAFPAEFYVAAPEEYDAELSDDNFRTDDRFRGAGTVAITVIGRDQLGLDVVEVEFNASRLESGGGIVIDVQGKLSCSAM